MPIVLIGVALAALAGPVEKIPPKEVAVIDPVHPMYLGSVNAGIKFNDAYTEGNFSIVAPAWSSIGADATLSGGLFFIEPYISWGEQGEVATSLGFGYRHLIGHQPVTALTKHDGHQATMFEEGVVLGGNVFLDMLDTQTNHQFWQLGVGAEILTRYLEFRGNYYIPLTDKKEVGTFSTQQSFQTTSQQTSIVGADPYATGNSILQNYSQITTQTTSTTTIERLFRRYEEGMEGWDLEFGVLIPWVDRYMDAKVIAGYYAFDNQPFGPQPGGTGNVEGWKAGFELRPVPALVVNSTWYEDERLTGSEWTLGVRAEFPFEAGDLGDGKNLWSRAAEAFKPRRRHLVERMAEPVRRQNAAVKLAQSTVEDKDEMQSSVKKVTKVVSQSQGQLVLADDVVFVNDGPAVGNGIQAGTVTGTGTAEQPVLTIQQGADIAGPRSTTTGRLWSVYSQGVATKAYVGDVFLSGSTNLISSGKPIAGLSGRSFGTGPAPFLLGGIIAGLDPTGSPVSIGTLGVSGYVIAGGSTSTAGVITTGVGIQIEDVRNILLDSNQFLAPASHAVALTNAGTTATAFVAQNNSFFGSNGDDINIDTFDTSSVSLIALNNVHTESIGNGINIQTRDDSSAFLFASGSSFVRNEEDAISVMSLDISDLTAVISDNTMTESDLGGVLAEANGDSTMNLFVIGNTISKMVAAGIDATTMFGNTSTLNVTILNNNISFTDGPGIAVGNLGIASTMKATIAGNTVFGILHDGIYLGAASDALTDLTIAGNSITSTAGTGVTALMGGIGEVTLNISGNSIQLTANEGIYLEAGVVKSTITVAGNSITSTAGAGVMALMGGIGEVTLNISGNSIQLTAYEGIYLNTGGTVKSTITVFGNSVSMAQDQGIHLDAEGNTETTIVVANNSLSSLGLSGDPDFGAGLSLHAFENAKIIDTSVSGNGISLATTHGVELLTEDSATIDVKVFNGNVITGSLADGINLNTQIGSLKLNGVTNNFVGPSGGMRLNTLIDASGTIILNGVAVPLPSIVP